MRAHPSIRVVGALFLVASFLHSQEPPEKVVIFCDPKTPTKNCSKDSMEVTFDDELTPGKATSDSIFQYDTFPKDARIATSIVMDTKSEQVQGWSFGVDHDEAFLTLDDVTVDGTVAEAAKGVGFVVASLENIERCAPDSPTCAVSTPVRSYISAVLLHLTEQRTLPIERNRLCAAGYTLDADPGPNGTLIFLTDRLKRTGSPPVAINVTADGKSVIPSTLIDGWVRRSGDLIVEDCGNGKDDDEDGKTDCDDRDCAKVPPCVPPPEVCDNGKDDDLDGRTDCDDGECSTIPPCVPPVEICDNGKDDDNDARADCEDADCEFVLKCRRENCGNEFDDNGDGAVDCDDKQCAGAVLCVPEICDNEIDDNRNAMTDCYDPDCVDFPACEPKTEICDNGMDEDFDGRFDCSDADCKGTEGCQPRPEVCDNREDDDRDGRTDCRDSDCVQTEACAPKPEICDNCFDDDRDGDMDCLDSECLTHPFCAPKPEVCDNGIDDDDDGMTDEEDTDCWLPSPLPLGVCESYALYFGPAATTDDHAIADGSFAISLRNRSPVLSFRFCVSRTETAEHAVYELTSEPVEASASPRGIRVLNDWRTLQSPKAANRATGLPGETMADLERGSVIAGFAAWDFLSHHISPGVKEGPCLVVDYVVDLNLGRPRNVIPPTGSGDPCPVNEILKVKVAPKPPAAFRRGDLDGVDGLGVTDALIILNWLVFDGSLGLDCEDALDVDDDGALNLTDPIVILRYQFQGGTSPAEPFESCGADLRPDDLSSCVDSNCR